MHRKQHTQKESEGLLDRHTLRPELSSDLPKTIIRYLTYFVNKFRREREALTESMEAEMCPNLTDY